jgi:4,5-DOPA dioxygenase extradiol
MPRQPSLFLSHGAPTYALDPGIAGPQLTRFGLTLPRPQAVLVVSPHWMTREVTVCTQATTRAMYDFGGFPAPLYSLRYAPPGHPALAQRALQCLRDAGFAVQAQATRDLDHGVWVPLRFLYPAADVPVFQVSMPQTLTPASAFQLGAALSPLAQDGVLIVGSGSLTHNLYEFQAQHADAPSYVREFVQWIRAAVQTGDLALLTQALERAPHAARAHPTTEHFLPLLVAAGAHTMGQPIGVLEGGIANRVLSMESYVFGAAVDAQGAVRSGEALAAV